MLIKLRGKYETGSIWLNGDYLDVSFSLQYRNHSPAGFAWGYCGSGPAQLALAILLKSAAPDIALSNYQKFKCDVIAKLPKTDFCLEIDVSKYI